MAADDTPLAVLTDTPDGLFLRETDVGPKADVRMHFRFLLWAAAISLVLFVSASATFPVGFPLWGCIWVCTPWLIAWLYRLRRLWRPVFRFDGNNRCVWRDQERIGAWPDASHLRIQAKRDRRDRWYWIRYRLALVYPDDPIPWVFVLVESPASTVHPFRYPANLTAFPSWEDVDLQAKHSADQFYWLPELIRIKTTLKDYLSCSSHAMRHPGETP